MSLVQRILRAVKRPGRASTDARLEALLATGYGMHREGELSGAESHYRQAVELAPDHAPARHLLGALLGQLGRLDEAREALQQAVQLDPTSAPALVDYGHTLRLQGDAGTAATCYREALEIDPQFRLAAVSLGEVALTLGDAQAAARAFEVALEPPADPKAVRGTVSALESLGRIAEARRICEQILIREPDHAEAHATLGYLLLKREYDPEAALEHLDDALRLRPANSELHANRGIALHDLGRLDEAIAAYDAALAADSACEIARFHRSLALLSRGQFESAWMDYEVRLMSEDAVSRPFPFPRWNGEDLAGKTLLVTAEQGIGDEIMFASCLPDVLCRARHVIVECSQKLEPIFRRSFAEATVHGGSQLQDLSWIDALPPVDLTCPIGSLPLYLRPSRSAFPRHAGYLRPDWVLAEEYRRRLDALGPGLKVGLSWRGGTMKSRRTLRSLTLEQLTPVLGIHGVHFVDLQYDDGTPEIQALHETHGYTVHHWRDALVDYDRTAALVSALDLVVSVCTAVIHLGGALGKPVWVMAPCVPEWRYGASGEQMPWFPSVRIVRQTEARNWTPVIERIAADLREWSTSQLEPESGTDAAGHATVNAAARVERTPLG
jgi:tetratricopeptide (TPR) repeat protein